MTAPRNIERWIGILCSTTLLLMQACSPGHNESGTKEDLCPQDPDKTEPGLCGCGVPDQDSDDDGTMDCNDICPQDPDKTEPGLCGCGVPDQDSDDDGTMNCNDVCPQDPDKTEPGLCGCGIPDEDGDGDGVLCDDQCPGYDDHLDADGDGIPNGCDLDSAFCETSEDCSDGMDCTQHDCIEHHCRTTSLSLCAWPAESADQAENITDIAGPVWNNEFSKDLSGAVWNPETETLWVCRNKGPSKVWAIVEDGSGGYAIDSRNGNAAEWEDFGDAEGLTLADFSEPYTLYVLAEGLEHIREWDLSRFGSAVMVNDWDISQYTPTAGGAGSEGITFVPDRFLAAQGFVDGDGHPYQSTGGMGGLMFVGHQNGGGIYVFDLDRTRGDLVFVGQYQTSATETAGLEFDRSTGLLYIWHGADFNQLETARLDSTQVDNHRKLHTVRIQQGPGKPALGSDNLEGIAVDSIADCHSGTRRFFMTTDGGNAWSLLVYNDFPCRM